MKKFIVALLYFYVIGCGVEVNKNVISQIQEGYLSKGKEVVVSECTYQGIHIKIDKEYSDEILLTTEDIIGELYCREDLNMIPIYLQFNDGWYYTTTSLMGRKFCPTDGWNIENCLPDKCWSGWSYVGKKVDICN